MNNFNPYLQTYLQTLQQQFQPQMTMPTIHADIIQVGSIEEVDRYPVGAGASQMFVLRDDSAIIVKSASVNGSTLDIYDKRPPTPPEPAPKYVTQEELEARLSALTRKKGEA